MIAASVGPGARADAPTYPGNHDGRRADPPVSLVARIIDAMPSEETTDIPDTWRSAVHPRRHGLISPEPALGLGLNLAGGAAGDTDLAAGQVDDLVAARGLARAAAAFVETCAHHMDYVPSGDSHQFAVLRPRQSWIFWSGAGLRLRSMLAVAPQEVYDEAVAALTPLRDGLPRQRSVISYLLPDLHEWVSADLDLPVDYPGLGGLLFYSASTAGQLSRFRAGQLAQFVSAYDAIGSEAAPLIGRWLAQGRWSPDVRRDAVEVLTRIASDGAFDCLLDLIDVPDVSVGVLAAAERFPKRAARLLAARRDDELIGLLFQRHLRAHPDLPGDALVPRVPDAPAEAVPPLLSSPPWTRKPPARVTVAASPLAAEPRMAWADGEQDEWADDWKDFLSEEMLKHLPLAETGDAPTEFYISAPADVVRPRLARWKAESGWFYLQNPRVIVGKYELDALAPIVRLARSKPAIGAALLMPFLAQEVADLMAGWLVRSRQFRPVAQDWFTRHGSGGAALLIPEALGAPPARSRTAATALTRLDADDVRTAAEEMGCQEAVEALLARDPLDLVPARIPAVPAWADPELLPQVLLAGRRDALPSPAVRVLLRMIAMSQLDAPYEGLREIAGHCDPGSLSDFAWSLYRVWELEGRPSKEAWAMNCLGYFGDEAVADRLAPLVRSWPSEGAAPRAKRGADVLAAMGCDVALGHLSALARNAKSTPLRAHATLALDRAAASRGLLPEQLDDLLAPDLGLDADPVEYGGVSYPVDLGNGQLVLRDPAGRQLTTLPSPASDDDKQIASAWNGRRRKAKPLIADQTRRLEEAMIVQRRWAAADFRSRVAAHPLLGRLARRLVWALDDRTAVLDPLGDLLDLEGGLVAEGKWVRLAHPAVDDLTPWRSWLARLATSQPFAQLEREVFPDQDPSAYWQRTIEAAALYRLLKHGWHWGPTGRQTLRGRLLRPFGAEGRVVLTIDPGVSAVYDAQTEPEQTITELVFESSRGELGVFGDLPLVTRSELIRSLRTLG